MELKKNVKNENGTNELEIGIDSAAYQAAVASVFKKNAKKYRVPGFRPGKAPRHLIEQMYGKDVFLYDAVNEMFPEVYADAVKEAGIEPVDRPEVEIVSCDETGVVLKAVVTVKPEVELGEYKGLKAEKKVHTVEDLTVDDEIERMRLRNARTITKEGAAEMGDVAVFDYEGFLDGTAFEGGKGENHSLELGSGQFIPGFEEQLVGHKAGEEFEIKVTFPEEYAASELAGKETTFKIKMHEVQSKELPEADDEFAKDVSEYDTLAELKDSIRKDLQDQMDRQAELAVENDLVSQVVDGMKVNIPDCMIRDEIDMRVNDFAYRMASQGLQLSRYLEYTNSTMEQFRDSFKEQAEKQVRMRLALEKIAKLEGIEVTDEEFEAEIKRLAEQYNVEPEKLRATAPAEEVKADLANNKAVDFIKANATIVEVEAKKAEAEAEETAAKEAAAETAEAAKTAEPAKKKTTRRTTKKTEAKKAETEE